MVDGAVYREYKLEDPNQVMILKCDDEGIVVDIWNSKKTKVLKSTYLFLEDLREMCV